MSRIEDDRGKDDSRIRRTRNPSDIGLSEIWRKRYNDVKPKSWQGFKFVSISTNRDRSLEEGDKSINRIDLHSK